MSKLAKIQGENLGGIPRNKEKVMNRIKKHENKAHTRKCHDKHQSSNLHEKRMYPSTKSQCIGILKFAAGRSCTPKCFEIKCLLCEIDLQSLASYLVHIYIIKSSINLIQNEEWSRMKTNSKCISSSRKTE